MIQEQRPGPIPLAIGPLPPLFLLLIRYSSGPCLGLPHLPQINPNRPVSKRVRLGQPAVLLVGRPQAAHEGVQAAPRLPERAAARARRVGLPEKRAPVHVDLGLPELVEVAHEVEHVGVG
ncbi:serine/threonine phosphatase 7 [Striga asiatica]|uniref:Serine/threonine phosphatase 7 n=1 Tax=Striga asiatica TaxID=4170 RepID=A0A5A7QF71_STRAF|nr:serine/threonine phosphatase 7 [Striga asiatica]